MNLLKWLKQKQCGESNSAQLSCKDSDKANDEVISPECEETIATVESVVNTSESSTINCVMLSSNNIPLFASLLDLRSVELVWCSKSMDHH